MLTREDVVLLLADGASGRYPLDRFRLMKGCFLVAQGRPQWGQLFNFQPYDYGPFDASVYSARDVAAMRGMLEVDFTSRYEAYRLTPDGEARVREVEGQIGTDDADWIRNVGRWLTSSSFSGIAHRVYEAFPDYATRSRLRT